MSHRLHLLLLGLSLLCAGVNAQQDPQYSQYMFNSLVMNPACAGSRDALHLNLLLRKQWMAIQGSPLTQTFSIHAPSRNLQHGFGLTVVNDGISYINQTWISADYSYRILLPKGKLCLGLRGMIYNYRIAWEKADMKNPTDNVGVLYPRSFVLPNAGFGAYYYSDKFYAGISVPHLLIQSFDPMRPSVSLSEKQTDLPTQRRHYFVTAGYVFTLDKTVKLKPSFLLKYVHGIQPEADVSANVYFSDRFGFGLSWRSFDGVVGMLEYWITPQLRAGYAYDYPLTVLNNFSWGSHEFMLSWDFRYKVSQVIGPRVF